jgi:hypothetical protein
MIFISYSLKDEASYSSLCLALEAANLSYWNQNLKAGTPLKDQLREAISKCDVCIFVATRDSAISQWCLNEIGAFWGAGKRIILYVANAGVENKLPPLFKGDFWTSDAREVIRQVREALDELQQGKGPEGKKVIHAASAGWGVDYVDRALRSATTTPVLEEVKGHIRRLQELADTPGHQGESIQSLLSQVEHLYGQMGGLWRLSNGDLSSELLLRAIQSELDKLQRTLKADEKLRPYKAKLLKIVSGDEHLLHVLLEALAGPTGVLRIGGSTIEGVFREATGEHIARVEGALARAGYRTELMIDEERGLWEIETVAAGGAKVLIGWELASEVELQNAVQVYESL